MNKTEFLEILRKSLSGGLNAYAVQENLQYYSNYIDEQIRNGQSESAVIASLGDPRLLAKTIINTSNPDNMGTGSDRAYYESYEEEANTPVENAKLRFSELPNWLRAILIIMIVIVVIAVIGRITWALLPVIIPVAVIIWILKLLKRG